MKSSRINYIILAIQIVISFCTSFFEYDKEIYILLGNSFGYSIATNIREITKLSINEKESIFKRFAPISLLSLNVLNIISLFISIEEYVIHYTALSTCALLIMLFIFDVKRVFR